LDPLCVRLVKKKKTVSDMERWWLSITAHEGVVGVIE